MSGGPIANIAALEACLGKTPGPMHLKVIDHLDSGACRFLSASPLMFAGFGSAEGVNITLGGGALGFVQVVDASRMRLPFALLDAPGLAQENHGFGGLFLVPGIGETLRINGRVASIENEVIEVAVNECYVHCAKALIRSDFWKAIPAAGAPSDRSEYLAAARFMALATIDGDGHADVSPKGDPAGLMIRLSEDAAWFADRPGNRRADSFRNILKQPRVAVAALIPGMIRIALLTGKAHLTTDDCIRAEFTVREKTPLLATRMEHPEVQLLESPTLERARLWPVTAPRPAIDPAAMLVEHAKLSKARGLQATLVRATLKVPGLMQKGLEHDYKNNLY